MSDATQPHYGSPAAFRRALTDRLKNLASKGSWTLAQLQRQIAYDRLLRRLYLVDDGWVVKGATALLARNLGVRATIDIDLYRAQAQEVAEADFRAAVARDAGDWFSFEVGARQPVDVGIRLPSPTPAGGPDRRHRSGGRDGRHICGEAVLGALQEIFRIGCEGAPTGGEDRHEATCHTRELH